MRNAVNVTFDVYRAGNSPPAAPDIAGAAGQLQSAGWPATMPAGPAYTHVLHVELNVDVRDDYDAGTLGPSADRVYIPDQEGTAFTVVFVERLGRGGPDERKRVYLLRHAPTWPTTEL